MDLPHPAREHLPGLRAHRQHGAPAEQQRQQRARRRVEGLIPDRMPAPAEQLLHPPLKGGGEGVLRRLQCVILQPGRIQYDFLNQPVQRLLRHGNSLPHFQSPVLYGHSAFLSAPFPERSMNRAARVFFNTAIPRLFRACSHKPTSRATENPLSHYVNAARKRILT